MRGRIVVGAVVGLLVLFSDARGDVQVRVATFNIQDFPSGGTTQFNAARDILIRVGADVVALQEIDNVTIPGEDFNALAGAAGYPFKFLAHGTNSFDSAHHAGIMSVYPFAATPTVETSITLSGDGSAKDITRNYLVAPIAVTGAGEDLIIITDHWKSGTTDADEFRRAVESIRAMQITANYDSTVIPYILCGDMNDDIGDAPPSGSFNSLPSGLPASYSLGSDMSFPIAKGVFTALQAGTGSQNLTEIPAFQLAGSPLDATRKISGRRLDYLWRSTVVTVIGSEVYDSADEGLGGLAKFGSPLPSGTSDDASDHLLVFADITIPDNQSGACCTACGCDDTVNEAQCLALGGDFRGAGVACGLEIPPCPAPPNDMLLNEVLITHNGAPEDKELIEIVGQPHGLLCGLSILVIEGELSSKGRVDLMLSLDDCGGGQACALDADGYFAAGGSGLSLDLTIGFGTNIFENGTQTIALVRDAVVSIGDDIDTDNDGIVDIPVGTVLDAVGVVNGDYPSSDKIYFSAPAIGPGPGGAMATGGARCPDGFDTDSADDWVRLSADTSGADGCVPLTPGAVNPSACGGDGDGDTDVDLADFAGFQRCFEQATAACSAYELDGDCGITLADYEIFASRQTNPQ